MPGRNRLAAKAARATAATNARSDFTDRFSQLIECRMGRVQADGRTHGVVLQRPVLLARAISHTSRTAPSTTSGSSNWTYSEELVVKIWRASVDRSSHFA